LLTEESVFDSIGQDPRFAECVQRALTALDGQGPREVIEQFLAAGQDR
jgi:mannitol 2-dehydrogenase